MTDKTERRISDAEALDKIAALHLDEMSYENPTSALESISMLVADTGRAIAVSPCWEEGDDD